MRMKCNKQRERLSCMLYSGFLSLVYPLDRVSVGRKGKVAFSLGGWTARLTRVVSVSQLQSLRERQPKFN